jgi:hypothetical protein
VIFINRLKIKYSCYKLKKEKELRKTKPFFCNLKKAKSVGVIYDASIKSEFETVQTFIKDLKALVPEVISLGYINGNETKDFHIQPKDFQFFNNNDLNWSFKPKNNTIQNFASKKFDILIDLSMIDNLPIIYILKWSQAKFIVGKKHSSDFFHHDLMIDVPVYVPSSYYIEQLVLYLNMINSNN